MCRKAQVQRFTISWSCIEIKIFELLFLRQFLGLSMFFFAIRCSYFANNQELVYWLLPSPLLPSSGNP